MIRFRGVYPIYDNSAFLISCRRRATPEIVFETVQVPQRAGLLAASKTHGANAIDLTFELLGHSAEKNASIAAALVRWAESPNDGQFVFDELPDRFFLARLNDVGEVDYAEQYPTLDMNFVCVNPYGFSLDTHKENVGQDIDYQGDVSAYPQIIFTPTTDTESPSWSDGARFIRLDGYTVQAGHTITVDNANRVITDNDTPIMEYLTLDSSWLTLTRGINTFTGSGGRVEWRNVYL